MWFVTALICLLSWGAADIFYKKSASGDDRQSHLKTAVWVGLIMGISAFGILIFTDTEISLLDIVKYSPASAMYILSMVIGYAGMRYLEISIISPVQNSSGALSAVCMIIWFVAVGKITDITEEFGILDLIGTAVICVGVLSLAIVEKRISDKETPSAERARGKAVTGAAALIFPLLYCLFDTLGTAADGIILDETTGLNLSELQVVAAYGLTFFVFGIGAWLYLLIFKKTVYNPLRNKSMAVAAVCETFGQFFYVFAMAGNPVVAAPMISAYCIVSVVFSRIFLKEKLRPSQYITVSAVIAGILLLGISEGIASV